MEWSLARKFGSSWYLDSIIVLSKYIVPINIMNTIIKTYNGGRTQKFLNSSCLHVYINFLHFSFLYFTFQRYGQSPDVFIHPSLADCIVVSPLSKLCQSVEDLQSQIIVDLACGLAVLRGADVFAPGILGMPVGKIIFVPINTDLHCLLGIKVALHCVRIPLVPCV